MEQWALLRGASDIVYLYLFFKRLQYRPDLAFDPRSANPLGAHNRAERPG